MEERAESRTGERKTARRGMLWTVFAIAVVASAVVWWQMINARAQRELDAARAAFAAHGMPTRIEELVSPRGPDEIAVDAQMRATWQIMSGSRDWENSRLTDVFAEINELELTRDGDTAEAATEVVPAALARMVELATDAEVVRFVASVHRVTQHPSWRPDHDYTLGPALLMPTLGPLRNMVRVLTRRALALAQDPEIMDAAWADLMAAQILANWAGDTPAFIPLLTEIACRGMIQPEALRLLETGKVPPELDAIIDQQVRALDAFIPRFERAIHGERIVMFGWIEHHLARQSNWLHALKGWSELPPWVEWADPWLTSVLSPLGRPRLKMEIRLCLDAFLRASLIIRAQSPTAIGDLRQIAKEPDVTNSMLAGIVLPTMAPLAVSPIVQVTKSRSLIIVLAAVRYHDRNGTWPATIAELGFPTDMSIDACSGRPLILRANSGSLTVYGCGFDGDDDAGMPVSRGDIERGNGDIVTTLRWRTSLTK